MLARQHAPCGTSSRLTPALRASLRTFQRLACTAAPRVIPLSTEFCAVQIIYADAFFLLGETKFRIDQVVQNKIGLQSNMIPNLNMVSWWCCSPSLVSLCSFVSKYHLQFCKSLHKEGNLFSSSRRWRRCSLCSLFHQSYAGRTSRSSITQLRNSLSRRVFRPTMPSTPCLRYFGPQPLVIGVLLNFERVSSKANNADAVSRHDRELMLRLGAKEVYFDFSRVWDWFLVAVREHRFADEWLGLQLVQSLH